MARPKYDTSIVVWEKDQTWLSGVCKMTPEFLEELLARYDEGDPSVVDTYNDEATGYIKVDINLNYQEEGKIDFLGNLRVREDEKPKSKKRRPRNEDYSDSYDDEDAPPPPPRRSSRSNSRSKSRHR